MALGATRTPPATAAPVAEPAVAVAGRTGAALWSVVVAAAVAWGGLVVAGSGASLRAAPVAGRWAWHGGHGTLPAILVGGAVVRWGPGLAARLPWRAVPWLAAGTTVAWTTALGASDGWSRLTEPLTTRHEYEPFAATVGDLGRFVAGFTDGLASYPIHVQGHPPGPVALAWALDRTGLGGAGWLAALALTGWGVAAAASLVAAREVAGERAARRAAPALAVLPGAVWAGTSLDALFAGLGAAGCCLAVVAIARSSTRSALAAGLVLGAALLCTYGAALLLVVPVVVAVALGVAGRARAAFGAVAWMAVAVVGGLGVAAAAGFSWLDGLYATRAAYWSGIGGQRPGWYLTLAGNPGALGLAAGPAVAAGLAHTLSRARTRWRPALLPGAALAALVVADLSQMTRGEVERIWLPFVPWLALAAPGHRRAWLAVQVALALVLQSALRSPW